eukprot:759550-Hanusia_phi.AAC.6
MVPDADDERRRRRRRRRRLGPSVESGLPSEETDAETGRTGRGGGVCDADPNSSELEKAMASAVCPNEIEDLRGQIVQKEETIKQMQLHHAAEMEREMAASRAIRKVLEERLVNEKLKNQELQNTGRLSPKNSCR